MEALGQKLKQARLARKITLEEASRVTKIRPARITEIEQDDFSSFASLAYAKGFILIYGKFLEVDVTPYLDAFEISDRVTVDGYSYLQEGGPSAPPPIVRRQSRKSPALVPFVFAIAVLVIGLYLIKLFLNIQRIAPTRSAPLPETALSASATPATPAAVVAPRAEPVEGPPASEAMVTPVPTAAAPTAAPATSPTEPEVRRALPVHTENLLPTPSPQ